MGAPAAAQQVRPSLLRGYFFDGHCMVGRNTEIANENADS
jgi:hypothetical protein